MDDKDEWKRYSEEMYPAIPLKGDILQLLKEELKSGFCVDPENPEEEVDPITGTPGIYELFVRKAGGLSWLNALHQFEEPDTTPTTTPLGDTDDDETVRRQEKCNELFSGKYTPLTYVLMQNDSNDNSWRTVKSLIQMGADPNLRDGIGRTPLFHCVTSSTMSRLKTFYILLECQANALALCYGKTIAMFAKELSNDGESNQLMWEGIQQRYGISDNFFEEHDVDDDSDDEDESNEEEEISDNEWEQ